MVNTPTTSLLCSWDSKLISIRNTQIECKVGEEGEILLKMAFAGIEPVLGPQIPGFQPDNADWHHSKVIN